MAKYRITSVPQTKKLNTYAGGGEYGCADDEKWDERQQKCVKIVQNLSESTIYDPEGKKIQTNLFQKLKDAKDAYQNFTKQHRGKKYKLNEADSASSIEQLRKGVQLYKDEYAKEQEQTKAELKKLENLKSKAALKGNTDIHNLNLKDLNTVKGKMKIEDAIRNSSLDSGTIAALYKGFGLDEIDANVKKGSGPNAQYSAKEAKAEWKPEIMEDVGDYAHKAAMGILGIAGAGALAGAAGATGNAVGKVLSNPFVSAPLSAYGVYDATTNTLPEAYRDFSEGRYLEGLGNTALAGLDLMPGAVLGDFKRLGQAVNKGVKNTYKINPWAEKLKNANSSYRVAGLNAAEDFQNTGILRSVAPKIKANFAEGILPARPTSFPSFQKGYADMSYAKPEGSVVFETKLPTFKRGEINPVTGFPVKGRHYAHRVIDPKTGATMTEIPGEHIRMFGDKPHWLKGYQEIPTELPGSPNASISGRLKQFFDRPPGPLMLGMPTGNSGNMVKKNTPYYEQLLNTYDSKVMSATNKKFYKDLIGTAKKQDGMLTEAQVRELDRLKTGNFDFGKRGYNKESLIQVEPKSPLASEEISTESKTKRKLSQKIQDLDSLLGEGLGYLVNNKNTQRKIDEGNTWLKNWINAPETQAKIDTDFQYVRDRAINNPNPLGMMDAHDLAYMQGKSFEPNSKMFPLKKQFRDYRNSKSPIHSSNFGVSYMHQQDPYVRHAVNNDTYTPIERYGSWISRSPFSKDKVSTTVHEGTHDWVGDFTLTNSGQKASIESNYTKEQLDNLRQWQDLRSQGIEPGTVMGNKKAYEGYMLNPTEVHARIMELRKHFNLTPKSTQEITTEEAKKILKAIKKSKTPIDSNFADVVKNDPDKLKYLFKRLWAAPIATAGAVGTAAMLANPFQGSDGLQQQKKGGATKNFIELELPKNKIQDYINQGYIVEEID